MTRLAPDYDNVVANVERFNKDLPDSEDLQSHLSYFRAWYYIPNLDMVGPSKFIGYKDMTADKYAHTYTELDGRETEPHLSQWFRTTEERSPEYQYVFEKVRKLLSQYDKSPSRVARFSTPYRTPNMQAGEGSSGVEAVYRAYTALSQPEKSALYNRISKEMRDE